LNFLAHLHLSGSHEKILVGNFIADFVKGRLALAAFEPDIVLGIELHRAIDTFTDSHAIVKQSKLRLKPKYNHYSGVVVDMFYDHFLAKSWHRFHVLPLTDFSHQAYNILNKHFAILPARVQHMLPFMSAHNWLLGYGTEEGLHRALAGMAKRTPYQSRMEEAVADLKLNYHAFEAEFTEFFPALEKFTEEWFFTKQLTPNIQPPPIR
jgi:acyl carrier protein phosphodiesterase